MPVQLTIGWHNQAYGTWLFKERRLNLDIDLCLEEGVDPAFALAHEMGHMKLGHGVTVQHHGGREYFGAEIAATVWALQRYMPDESSKDVIIQVTRLTAAALAPALDVEPYIELLRRILWT